MALSLITKAWPIVMQTGRKFVLVALCDAANDDGQCFLCVETIAYKCGMGLRTVQGHLIDLEADSFIWREERLGRSSIYSVNVVTLEGAEKNPLWIKRQLMKRTPARTAGVAKTPAVSAEAPADSAHPPAGSAPIPVSQPSPTRKNNNKARECVLPADFEVNGTGMALAEKLGLNADDELEAFKDHHAANGSTFVDWQAAFRTWTRNAAKFAKRNQRGTPAAAMTANRTAQPLSFAQQDELAKRKRWEEMTGRPWPADGKPDYHVIDITPTAQRIA